MSMLFYLGLWVLTMIGPMWVVQSAEAQVIYDQTSGVPNKNKPLYFQEGNKIYPLENGRPDYSSKEVRIIKNNRVWEVIPGTNTPRYNRDFEEYRRQR